MIKDNENALRYLEKGITLNKREGMNSQLGMNHFTRGKVLTAEGRIEEAITSFRESAQIMEQESNVRHLVSVKSELADRLIEVDRLDEAFPIIEDCVLLAEKVGNSHALVNSIAVRGRIHAKRGKYRLAYKDAEESMAFSRQYDLPDDRRVPYQLYLYLDSLTNHPLEATRLREYMALKDTLLELAETEKIAELRTQLATAGPTYQGQRTKRRPGRYPTGPHSLGDSSASNPPGPGGIAVRTAP